MCSSDLPQGEGSVSISYHTLSVSGHYAANGGFVDLGGSRAQTLHLSFDYALTDRLGLWTSAAYVSAKNGDDPSPVLGHAGIDDGRYHSTWQDLHAGARFALVEEPVAITPFVEMVLPLHDYETRGEAAPGRGLRQATVGLNIGRQVMHVPGMYVHLRYGHTFVERHLDVGTDRDNLDLEVGMQIRPRWGIRGLAGWQETQGGLNFPEDVLHDHDLFDEHDRLLDDEHLKAGLGAAYSASDSVTVHVIALTSLAGSNTHRDIGMAVGASWHFGPR